MIAASVRGTELALPRAMQTALRLVNMPTDEDDRDTLPPSAPITGMRPPPPEGANTLEEIAHYEDPEAWSGYDESKFLHRATAAVIKGTNALLKAKQESDIEAILKRQTVLFQDALKPEFSALKGQIGKNEDAVKALERKLEDVKEHLRSEVSRLETEIQRVRALATGQQQ